MRKLEAFLVQRVMPLLMVATTGLFLSAPSLGSDIAPYKNPKLSVDARVKDLLGRMTVAEKMAQLRCDGNPNVYGPALKSTGFGEIAPILRGIKPSMAAETANRIQKEAASSRLGIPVIIHDEALHGLIGNDATSFPQAIGLAATWNPALVGTVSSAIAQEVKSRGIRHVLSPVINVVRDARWGRVEETYGEDPLINTRIGVEFIKGFEANGVVTTPKHYVANVWDGGRDSHSVNVSERQLREIYLPPFKAAFQEAGARSVMAAYGSLNGFACSANRWLLTDLLRTEWGFKGFVVSDYGSVSGILWAHHTAGNEKEAAAQAVNAGMDMEYPDVSIFGKGLEQAVSEKLISAKALDTAVSRILRVKFELGLFEDNQVDVERAEAVSRSESHRELALAAARQSLVLLKNSAKVLPLSPTIKSIAVVGPHVASMPLGGYSGNPKHVVSVLEALQSRLGKEHVLYAKGCDLANTSALPAIPTSALIPEGAEEEQHGLTGQYFDNKEFSGKAKLTRVDAAVNFNWDQGAPDPKLPANGFSVRWTGYLVAPKTGSYRVAVTSDDGARLWVNNARVVDNWGEHAASTVGAIVSLEAGKRTPIRLDYYEASGFASCQLGWAPVGESQLDPEIAEAVKAASSADATLMVAGILEGEGRDRAYLDLPGRQEQLIKALAATGKPIVVVLVAGAPVTMESWIDAVPAVLDAWYPGQEGGTAIVDALFGDANPGGKLPMTFPRTVGQCPVYYNLEPSGRGYDYVDSTGQPRFAFGHGLSYTEFSYSNLRIAPVTGGGKNDFEVTFDLKNVGAFKGDEVPQLYIHHVVASQVRPLKELKAFERVSLDPGQSKRVRFVLGFDELSFLDAKLQPVIEPGTVEVMVGAASDDVKLSAKLSVVAQTRR